MKTLVKGLTALLICGAMIGLNIENAEAADLTTDTVEIEELARHNHKPMPPPPPPRPNDRHRPLRHHDYFWLDPPPPPPPPHRHGEPRPHYRW